METIDAVRVRYLDEDQFFNETFVTRPACGISLAMAARLRHFAPQHVHPR
jgi:hypothetical protein